MGKFISSYSSLFKQFSFADFLLIEGNEQGALQKESVIAPFEERFKTATLRETN